MRSSRTGDSHEVLGATSVTVPARGTAAVTRRTTEGNDLAIDLASHAATGTGQELEDSSAAGVRDGEVVLSSGGR